MRAKNKKKNEEELKIDSPNSNMKLFKFIITLISAICLMKAMESNSSFDTMTGITIAGIYDYYILKCNTSNSKYSRAIKRYSTLGLILYSVGLGFSLAGNFGLIVEEYDTFKMMLRVFGYPTFSKFGVLIAFLVILGYNIVEVMIPVKRTDTSRVSAI